jgi:hypothetical protein
MAKSKYDRNIDKGAAQQRNVGQGTMGGNRPGQPVEETTGAGQQGRGGSKNKGGKNNPRRSHESSWRPKPTGGDNE